MSMNMEAFLKKFNFVIGLFLCLDFYYFYSCCSIKLSIVSFERQAQFARCYNELPTLKDALRYPSGQRVTNMRIDMIEEIMGNLKPLELPVGKERGYMKYNNEVFYYSIAAESIVNRHKPAIWKIMPNYPASSGTSLSIFVWKKVPKQFVEILIFHEIMEAKFMLKDNIRRRKAHQQAILYHMAYARKFLNQKAYEEFIEWQGKIRAYKGSLDLLDIYCHNTAASL